MEPSSPAPQPLPLFERDVRARPKPFSPAYQPPVVAPPVVAVREAATWYRLVTAIASCYVFVLAHTAPEPCSFEIDRGGRARCLLSGKQQWELHLPAAAYDQFELVVRMWREGALVHCLQVDSVRLGEPRSLPSGVRLVDILPAHRGRRTSTLARHERRS